MKKQKEKKQFRLRGKKLFLIYSQLDPTIKFIKEEILEQLKLKIKNIETYIIGEKINKENGICIYCYFETKIQFDTQNINYLDLQFNNKNYHGNYQIGKQKWFLIENVIKDENYISNWQIPQKKGKIFKPDEHLFQICLEKGLKEAEKKMYEFYPGISVRRATTILKNLEKINKFKVIENIEKIKTKMTFSLENFNNLPKEKLKNITEGINLAIEVGFRITLVLNGSSDINKTLLGRSIFNTMGIDFLEVNDINDFNNYEPFKHKGILINDLNNSNLSINDDLLDQLENMNKFKSLI